MEKNVLRGGAPSVDKLIEERVPSFVKTLSFNLKYLKNFDIDAAKIS